jgi:hypothetical protein
MRLYRTLAVAVIVAGLGLGKASAASWPVGYPAPATWPVLAPLPGAAGSLTARAGYFGSEDYFQAHGGNPRDYVIALYADVLGRPPAEAEIERWVSQYGACGDGVTLAREFLTYAQGELAARAAAAPPVVVVQPVSPPAAVAYRPVPEREHDRHFHDRYDRDRHDRDRHDRR